MMNLLEQLSKKLSGKPTREMAKQIGAEEQATAKGISSALPLLLGALANKTNSQSGNGLLSMLDRDHDGSVIDDLAGFIGKGGGQKGWGVEKFFGSQDKEAEKAIEKASPLSGPQSGQLLAMLAPVVADFLFNKKKEKDLDEQGLASELHQESERHGPAHTSLAGMANKLLDRDNDGSALDDVMKIGGGLLKSFR